MTRYTLFIAVSFLLLQITILPLRVHGSSPPENVETRPLWEFRIAATAARLPHYVGSDEYKTYLFPLPYLVYRGEFFQTDRDNMRAIFFKNGDFETDLSLWGNPPVPDNNRARTGMDELDALVEIGPAVRYYFKHNGTKDSLYIKGAIRTAFSVGWESGPEVHFQGLHGSVRLILKDSILLADRKMKFRLSSGIHFANEKFNSYFYDVGPDDVVPGRSIYTTGGGYSGFSVSGSITRELYPWLTFGCYGKWNNSSGATYDQSPLATTENNYTIGTMLIFTLLKSKTMTSRYPQ